MAELAARGVRVLLPVLLADMDLDWAEDVGPRVHSTLTPSLAEPADRRSGRPASLRRTSSSCPP